MSATVTYYLVRFDALDPKEDFNILLSALSAVPGLSINSLENNAISIAIEGNPFTATLKLLPSHETPISHSTSMLLQCEVTDNAIIDLFRRAIQPMQYRMYNTSLNCFLPTDTNLFEITQLIVSERAAKVFHTKGFKPLFNYRSSSVWYAESLENGSIHFINPYMLEYFVEYEVDTSDTTEFSYVVASNITEFVTFHDQQLIPVSFYEKYDRSLKIINHSGFDINDIERKIFVKPLFFTYSKEKQQYEMLTSEKSSLNFADKVRLGETIDMSLQRIVRDELKLADDYYCAKVTHKIDFDRDKENILIPRLWICIYLNTINDTEQIKQKANRGWSSLESNVN